MAFLTDFHCHTRVSPDSAASLYDMAMAEYAAGARYVTVFTGRRPEFIPI